MEKELLNELTNYIEKLRYVSTDDIPDLSLYMDQVTGFMEEKLSMMKRFPSDKALTKTMINNYAKNKLLPPPEKKRYSENHILMLLFIYYYKGIISLSDIAEILRPLNTNYFQRKTAPTLADLYEEVFKLEAVEKERLIADVTAKFDRASETFSREDPLFSALSEEEQEELRLFAFISELAFDVYLKKQLIEKLADQLHDRELLKKQREAAEKKNKK